MQITIEKHKQDAITPTDNQEKVIRLWDMDVERADREAIDHVLGHLVQSGTRPAITVTGDVVEIITAVTQTMQNSLPSQLSAPLKTMMDYLARWLCDYVDETGATVLRVTFGFDGSTHKQEREK